MNAGVNVCTFVHVCTRVSEFSVSGCACVSLCECVCVCMCVSVYVCERERGTVTCVFRLLLPPIPFPYQITIL